MLRVAFLLATTVSSIRAQPMPAISGEVVDAGGNAVSNMTASLCQNGVCGEQVQINSGRFRFQLPVARGNYTVQVYSIGGDLLETQPIVADFNQPPLRMVLPDSGSSTRNAHTVGPVSIRRLRHHPPKAASKELVRALESFKKNEPQAGADHLEKALVADPEFTDAHYLLGLTLEANGVNEKALIHLENAASVFPKAHVFAAKILSRTGHEAEAQTHLRKYLLTGDTTYRDKVQSFLRPAK